jgi:hypothetical protein
MAAQVVTVLSAIWDSAITFLPNIIGAVILLVIGLVLGKIIGRVVKEILDRVKLDYYVTETEKPIISLSGIFALITRWWIYLAFIAAAVSVLGILELVVWVRQILNFIPNIVGAALIVVVGYVLAEYIRAQMKKMKEIYASIVSKVLFFFIMYVSVALALPILGIPADLVNNILLVIIGSVGVGIAIAMGLGLKDAIAIVSKKYANKVKV